MDGVGAVVIVDELNHRVVRWLPGAEQGKVIAGGNGEGCGLGQLYLPRACALDGEGRLFSQTQEIIASCIGPRMLSRVVLSLATAQVQRILRARSRRSIGWTNRLVCS